MLSSCLRRRPQQEKEQRQQRHEQEESLRGSMPYHSVAGGDDPENHNGRVNVETVTDGEDAENLLPPTADTEGDVTGDLPPNPGVVYMFPKAWKERTAGLRGNKSFNNNRQGTGGKNITDPDIPKKQSSLSSVCTIS